ncbi:MAG: hypothetical protein PHF21_02440 [Bacilli bacterium]|nr:hypothetical protein [Bacilli bacterium]
MEKIKLRYILYFIGIFSTLILGISAYKAEKKHEERLYHVLHSKIKETAKECYLEKKCDKTIILQDLYDKEYLEELFDPVTKEKLDPNLCLEYKNEEVSFCS